MERDVEGATTRVVFMGSDLFSLPSLQALVEKGGSLKAPLEVVGVVTRPDRRSGRGRKLQTSPVKNLALEAGIPVVTPEKVRDAESMHGILSFDPQLMVVSSFGQILPRRLLETPRYGCLNLHPSLLPRHRGSSPVETALLQGEEETGVTLMVMTPKMDAGPIVSQLSTAIEPLETGGELAMRLAQVSASLLLRDLPGWIEGRLEAHSQEESAATYTSMIRKKDGLVDWTLPAEVIERKVRAFNPWPSAYALWGDRQLRVLTAGAATGSASPGAISGMEGGALVVGTGDGVLLVHELQLSGSKALPAPDFVRGHSEILSARLSSDVAWSSA